MLLREDDISIVPADLNDHLELTNIAIAAKRFWNYPEPWIEKWRQDLTIQQKDFLRWQIYKCTSSNSIVGFCALAVHPAFLEVEHLWIIPKYIGQGFGRRLLERSIEASLHENIQEIKVIADPNAVGFYEKLGFTLADFVPSTPAGRELPLMLKEIKG